MENCRICDQALGEPVYESPQPQSITSLCQVLEGRTRVWHCRHCDHTQTEPLPALDQFYAEDYHILTASEEDDQLYEIRDGRKIFRTEHQVATLRSKVSVRREAKVLDYGCGKASTLRALHQEQPDIEPSVFDVGEQYREFWNRFVPPERQAVDEIPKDWNGRFDLVTSFYALEHVADPCGMLNTVRGLLRDGGTFYFLVPNVFANTADLVVADHVNHFSARSLEQLLQRTGFRVESIDDQAHNSAWVVQATKAQPSELVNKVSNADAVLEMAGYWSGFGERVREFESGQAGPAAIYGSGFYGTFIHTCLADPDRVQCFLDQNPHRQKQELLGLPILAPESLPAELRSLYIGLNPRLAREAIEGMDCLRLESRSVFYP